MWISINGIINIGFITIGSPNIIGSFILKQPGPIDNLPISFNCLLFENSNRSIANENVVPEPPIF